MSHDLLQNSKTLLISTASQRLSEWCPYKQCMGEGSCSGYCGRKGQAEALGHVILTLVTFRWVHFSTVVNDQVHTLTQRLILVLQYAKQRLAKIANDNMDALGIFNRQRWLEKGEPLQQTVTAFFSCNGFRRGTYNISTIHRIDNVIYTHSSEY